MNASVEQALISKLRTLSPQQAAEVQNFVEFLAAQAKKRLALEATGMAPMSKDEMADDAGRLPH
jgi:hypothetical protein